MAGGQWATWIGFGALVVATINVVGGFLVTDRMLKMFAKKERGGASNASAAQVNGRP
jgi:NAD(P) transhydrogenase subunit alpha